MDPLSQGPTNLHGDAQNETLVGPFGPPINAASEDNLGDVSTSPYTAHRNSIRDLTLPQIPDMNIPPSPPGSPPPGVEEKFEHFLGLKRQGVHFNEKLAKSSALKNPSLLRKLMASAGVDEHDQYNTTLSKAVWNPVGFPTWAFKEELAKNQQEMTEKKEEERSRLRRESIEFVTATNSGQSSRVGTPGSAASKGLRGSAAERVMAGLDREKTKSPLVPVLRNDMDRRIGRNEGTQREMSARSPKRRKHSRSR